MILRKFVIPAHEILDVVAEKPVLFGGKNWYALKLDWADLFQHVALHRTSGWFKHVIFTPDYPDRFAEAVRTIMKSNP
jgi:hypothetical protein